MKSKLTTQSWLVSAGRKGEPGAPLNVPIVPASSFTLGGERIYTRDSGSPGWEALEEIVGGLEGGEAVAFSSGMAAVAAVFDQLGSGTRVVIPDDCYHGVADLARAGRQKGIWTVNRIAVEDTAGWVAAAAESDLVWLESPSNPLLTIADLKAICQAPRKPGAILAVDNTFATPLNQKPLELGADVSMHSATKFIGGHSDLLGGLLVTKHSKLLAAFRQARTLGGATPGALEAFLAVRGCRTLALRLEQAQETAGRLASWLENHVCVETVRYPGLENHPTHELAAAQLGGFGSMISFDVAGGAEAADAVCGTVNLIRHATSLGSVESTMERRAANHGQEHLPPALLRLSVGIESFEDLCADLEQAFAKAVIRLE
jgi:cystathionine gamma-synthase